MWSGGSEKGLLCKKKLIILEYALLLHFVWSGGSEKELLCEKEKKKGDKIKLHHFNWFNNLKKIVFMKNFDFNKIVLFNEYICVFLNFWKYNIHNFIKQIN